MALKPNNGGSDGVQRVKPPLAPRPDMTGPQKSEYSISDAGEILVDRVRVREVLDYVEPTEKVVHRARTVTVAAIIDEFRKGDDADSLVAVIVTEHGRRTQTPLGVVVRDDLASLLGRLPDIVA
ncbi:hypothetical protein [Rhodococcus ruber]|nr:hypothetical protein [Rhodococcus ruber]AXY49388.1 hypothetical protein YT1_p20015 [Rhodococcus ruber]